MEMKLGKGYWLGRELEGEDEQCRGYGRNMEEREEWLRISGFNRVQEWRCDAGERETSAAAVWRNARSRAETIARCRS